MRSYRHSRKHQQRSGGDFWLSFSDLMSSLVLIIVLVMFYIIYQYFNLAEINQAEIARRQLELDEAQLTMEDQEGKLTDAEEQMLAQQILLDAKQAELEDAQAILEAQQAELETAQTALADKETEIATQQSELDTLSRQLTVQKSQLSLQKSQLTLKQTQLTDAQDQMTVQQTALTDAQALLATQQTDLETAQTQLATQQTDLQTAQTELAAAQTQLAAQQTDLETAQTELAAAQTQLTTQQTQLEDQQQQLEALVGLKTRIITSLSAALKSGGISASVDPTNGSIALESDVMFETNQYKLSERGKAFIDRFLPVYLNVLFSDEYRDYVAEIIIEGHTDSTGSYLENLKLSQQRALAVATYVLEDGYDCISAEQKKLLRSIVTANGRSFSDLIRDEKGVEDLNASRRVVFKFRLTDEQMIQQLREILESE